MFNYSEIPDHMKDGLKLYVDHGIEPGSFLMAVLCNNLKMACANADHINRDYIFQWAQCMWNEVPSECQGSPERVEAWIKLGGIKGHEIKAS